jgi:hypothetical protein
MRLGDLLFAIILAGIGLALAHLRAEYVLHRRFKAAQHQQLIVQPPSAYLRANRKQWWKLRKTGSSHDIQQH